MHSKFYLCRHELRYSKELGYTRPVCLVYKAEGDIFDDFGYCTDRAGRWRWVHLPSGEYSRKSYKTRGACRSAVGRTMTGILYGKGGIYARKSGDKRRTVFRAKVEEMDRDYFSRLGITDENEQKSDESQDESEFKYWYQEI